MKFPDRTMDRTLRVSIDQWQVGDIAVGLETLEAQFDIEPSGADSTCAFRTISHFR